MIIEVLHNPDGSITIICLLCGKETIATHEEYEEDDMGVAVEVKHVWNCPVMVQGGKES